MAATCWLYSVESFPGTRTSGRFHQFLEFNGINLLHPGQSWVRLEPYYKHLQMDRLGSPRRTAH